MSKQDSETFKRIYLEELSHDLMVSLHFLAYIGFSFLVVGCKGTVNQYILALLESLVTYLHYNSCFILSIHTTGQQKYLLLI